MTEASVGLDDIVLDVGCGEGLVGFGALPLVGDSGRVVFTEVSEKLLESCRNIASEIGVTPRCRFVRTPAETLAGIESGSVDVVTTRSVLIYVADKAAAFDSFRRVLRPGGRISLFEPINRRYLALNKDTLFGYDIRPVAEAAAKVRAVFESAAPPDGSMLGFDESDLLDFVERAGFEDITVRLELSSSSNTPYAGMPWSKLLATSPNPTAPTYGKAIAEALTDDEAAAFEAHLRPLVEESAPGRIRHSVAYVSARRP
nr:class I SAM-dependent methyltransferase [Phytoactinopolyspora mesophila]